MSLNQFLRDEKLTLIVFVCITIPLVIHTQQLLLRVTKFTTDIPYLAEAYALFFAIGFDSAVFLFSTHKMKDAMTTFASFVFIINFLFFNLDILFVELHTDGNTAAEVARMLIGTLFSGIGAFLVYYCSETLVKNIQAKEQEEQTKKPKRRSATPRKSQQPQRPEISSPPAVKALAASSDNVPSNGHDKEEQKQKARALYDQGLSYRQISEEVSVGKSTVAKWIKEQEV